MITWHRFRDVGSTLLECVGAQPVVSRVEHSLSTKLMIFSMNSWGGVAVCVRHRRLETLGYGWNVFFLNILNEKRKNHKIKAAKKMKRLTHRGSRRLSVGVRAMVHTESIEQRRIMMYLLLFSSFSLMKITSALINGSVDENFPASIKTSSEAGALQLATARVLTALPP